MKKNQTKSADINKVVQVNNLTVIYFYYVNSGVIFQHTFDFSLIPKEGLNT